MVRGGRGGEGWCEGRRRCEGKRDGVREGWCEEKKRQA